MRIILAILFFCLNISVYAETFESISNGYFKNNYSPQQFEAVYGSVPTWRYQYQVSSSDGDGYFRSNAFKVYIPAGTISFALQTSLPQSATPAAVVKMDVSPSRITPLSPNEYTPAFNGIDPAYYLQHVLNDEEVVVTHDGSGTFILLGTFVSGRIDYSQFTKKGHWVYIRMINPYDLYKPTVIVLLDSATYKANYASIQWDANGDPVDTASGGGTTTPTTPPTPTTTPLTGITLTASSLLKGSSGTVTIIPTPSNASLGTCTASPANLVTISGSTIALASGASAITTNTPVTVTCGSVSQTLTIIPNTVPLTGVTLSRSSIASTDTTTRVVLSPSPAGAALPSTCKVLDTAGTESNLVTSISSSGSSYGFTVLSGTANLVKLIGQNQLLSVDCGGGVKTAFTVLMPLVAKSLIGNALEFNFLPSGTATTADLYIAGYIKDILPNKLTGKVESAWICRSYDDSNWVYMPGAILPRVCKRSGIKVNDKVRITIDATDIAGIGNSSFSEYFFTFSEKTLKDAKVELYGAYTTDNGTTFKFIGDDNTGTFSAQPPVGANVNALYIFK